MSVTVVGSANLDLVYRVPAIPAPGQTVLAAGRAQHLGGKGNNQATAAARAGAQVTFVAALGTDPASELIMDGLSAAGVAARVRRVADQPTGTALIMVDDAGENAITVDSGANASLLELDVDELSAVADARVLLLQLETPLATVAAAAGHAREAGTLVVLNAAPMTELPEDLLAAVDVLIVNETEAAELSGLADPEPALRRLVERVPSVIITLGAEGALIGSPDRDPVTVPGRRVQVVDTTGAGDTFCGALVAELDRRLGDGESPDLVAAAEFATVAASLSVQRVGAVPSIPSRAEILAAR